MVESFDVIIVGCGPAGITAAIQLKRMGFAVVAFEKSRPGGLLLHAGCVENYPGIRGSLEGKALADLFIEKLKFVGLEPVIEEVREWKRESGDFVIKTGRAMYRSGALILATGTRPKTPEFEICGEEAYRQRVTNDFIQLLSLPPSSVIIVGGGDAAFDYALSLASKAWRVLITFRKREPGSLGLLVERAGADPNIKVRSMFSPVKVECRKDSLLLHGTGMSEKAVLEASYILTAVGRRPEDSLLEEVAMPENLTGEVGTVPGLFVAGDVRRSLSRQTAIAAGDGMASAMAAARYLKSKR